LIDPPFCIYPGILYLDIYILYQSYVTHHRGSDWNKMSQGDNDEIADLLREIAAVGEGHLDDDDDDEDMDDADFEYYLDAEDIDEEMGLDEDYDEDDDEFFDDEDDEDGPNVVFSADPTAGMIDLDEDDEDEDEDGEQDDDDDDDALGRSTLRELAALLNNAPNADARSSLLARLLAGPGPGRGNDTGPITRSGQVLRRMGMGQGMTEEERARAVAERRRRERWWKPVLEPEVNGLELLQSGEFGRVKGWKGTGKRRRGPGRSLVRDRHYSWTPTMAQVSVCNTTARRLKHSY
jgi:hypothetical protein